MIGFQFSGSGLLVPFRQAPAVLFETSPPLAVAKDSSVQSRSVNCLVNQSLKSLIPAPQ